MEGHEAPTRWEHPCLLISAAVHSAIVPGTEFTLLVMPCRPPYMAGRSLTHITPRAPPHPLKHSPLLPPFAWDAKPSQLQLGMVSFRSILTSNITSSGWPSLTHPEQLPQASLSLLSIPLPSYISSEHLVPSEIILFIYLSTCLRLSPRRNMCTQGLSCLCHCGIPSAQAVCCREYGRLKMRQLNVCSSIP